MISSVINKQSCVKDLSRIYQLSAELTEFMEFFFEKNNGYKTEFVKGLKKSVSEARSKKLRKINSLTDLI